MKRFIIVVLGAVAIVAMAGGGALLALASTQEHYGLVITLLVIAFAIFVVDWIAQRFRDEGVIAGRSEAEQLYDGIGRKGEAQ